MYIRDTCRVVVLCVVLAVCCVSCSSKSDENKTLENVQDATKPSKMISGSTLVFVEELKMMMEKNILGICPQSYTFKMGQVNKTKNLTVDTCESDNDGELSVRLASLALRAHSASRSVECWRLGAALSNMFGELARTAAHRQASSASATSADNKKRKLSKSQKAKIQAKQRTALAVKKKAAAIAARIAS